MDKSESKPQPGILFKHDEDFLNRYANNVFLESTFWDLKITFGQTDSSAGPNGVIQHTAITLPWGYAKVLSYILQLHLAGREVEDGRIPLPKGILAPPPTEPSKEQMDSMKHPKEWLATMHKMWNEFVTANPELK